MKEKLPNLILKSLQNVLPKGKKNIGLHEPTFKGKEWQYVKNCIDTGWVSYLGEYVNRFEKEITKFTQVKYAVATVNGTAALHLSLLAIGVKPEDEVLAPAMTFIAPVNAICYCAATPHFVDVSYKTLGVDAEKLSEYLKKYTLIRGGVCFNRKTSRPIRAIIAMHTFGHPVDLDSLLKVCREYKITLIEDAAEALGSYYKGKHVGHWGKLSILSFNGNKIVTTGGGGAVITNNLILARKIKHLSTTAKMPHKWEFYHDQIGYNYRLPNINAALGCAQLEQINRFLKKKRNLAEKYSKIFKDIEGIKVFHEPEFARSNYWLNTLILDKNYISQRDDILKITNQNGIGTRPVWTLMNKLPMFKKCPKMNLSNATDLERRIINLPSSSFLI